MEKDGNKDIYIMDADGTNVKRLTTILLMTGTHVGHPTGKR